MPKIFNVGIVGVGYWGPNLVRNFYELPNSNVKICCDLDEDKLKNIKTKYPSVKTTQEYKDLLNDKEIDAIIISTSPGTHFELAKQALLYNKNVFVEKPLTINTKDAEELVELAKEKNKILMVGHTFEYSPPVNKLKELINKGELGEIYYIYTQRLNLGLFQKETNVMWDLATHDISIILYLFQKKPVNIIAKGKAHICKDIEDVAFITITFEDKSICNLHVSWLDPCKIRKMVIVGSKKMVVFDDTEQLEKIKIYTKNVSGHDKYNNFGEFHLSYNYGDITIPKIETIEPLKLECSHFLDCMENNKIPRSSGEVGLAVVRIVEAVEESIKGNGKEVRL